MIFIQADIESTLLGRAMGVNLFFPNNLVKSNPRVTVGVLTLLHGYGNNQWHWSSYSALVQYALENNLILIMPSADNSFYNNMVHGAPFYSWIVEEMPAQLKKIFNIHYSRETNFIAGVSMGGYGALRIGLLNPDKFAACGSFSGPLDLARTKENFATDANTLGVYRAMLSPTFGNDLSFPPEADVFHLSSEISKMPKDKQLKIFHTCGLQDPFLEQNRLYSAYAQSMPINHTYKEWDGVHEWSFWDRSVAEFISFCLGNNFASLQSKKWNHEYDINKQNF